MDIQWGDLATWTASAAALIFGWTGFRRAGKANKTAADALLVAKRQAASAERANLTADKALDIARRATKAAEESAAEAKRTADLAELSNARSAERNDVVWTVDSGKSSGTWKATNTGADIAYRAHVILKGDGVDERTEPVDVGHGETIEIDLQALWAKARIAAERTQQEFSAQGVLYMPTATLNLKFRILWETRTGTEHVWTTELDKQRTAEKRQN
jgi:hypothetical protein